MSTTLVVPVKWASWMLSVGVHVVSALLQEGLGVKSLGCGDLSRHPCKGPCLLICSRQSQAFRKRGHMCGHASFPVLAIITIIQIYELFLWAARF